MFILIVLGILLDILFCFMMKVLYIWVLFWRFDGVFWIINLVVVKFVRVCWNDVCEFNCIFNLFGENNKFVDEMFFEYLVVFFEQDCDEVFNDDIIQRVYNLVWNQFIIYNVDEIIDGMDVVVEDVVVRLFMDVVVVWYFSLQFYYVLCNNLFKICDEFGRLVFEIEDKFNLVIKVVFIGFNVYVCVLVVCVVFGEQKCGVVIVIVMNVFGLFLNFDKYFNYSRGVLFFIDFFVIFIIFDFDVQMVFCCVMGIVQL